MIHIFDKIYISYAETSVSPDSPGVLPESFVRIIDKGLIHMGEFIHAKRQLDYGKSIKEVLEKYESEEHFFNTLLQEISSGKSPKIIIYLDENSMLEFLIRWWKAIFPNLTSEGGYALYQSFSDSETLQPAKTRESFLDITVKSDKITFDKFAFAYWNESKSMFTDKFNSHPAFNLPISMTSKCSLEFLIMDYVQNPNEMKPELMAKISKLYRRQLTIQIFTMVRAFQYKLYFLASEINTLSQGAFLDGKTIKEALTSDSRFKIIYDYNIQESSKMLDYIDETYELQKVCKDLMELEILWSGKQGFDVETIKKLDPLVAYYGEHGTHPDIVLAMNEEIRRPGKYKLFDGLINKNRFNTFLIISFLNTIKSKGLEDPFVKEFELINS